jgi:hypothetical protein
MYELYKQENRAIDYIRVETILGILTFCLICYFQSLSVELNIAKMNIINVVFSAVLGVFCIPKVSYQQIIGLCQTVGAQE